MDSQPGPAAGGGPLAGIRVADFGQYVAGPMAACCWPTWGRT